MLEKIPNKEDIELARSEFSPEICRLYDATRQYHDGKWLWVDVTDIKLAEDVRKLIRIKRKPKN